MSATKLAFRQMKGGEPSQMLTDASTISWDCNLGYAAYVTITANRTLSITNMQDGTAGMLEVIQDGTGGHTLTVTGGTVTLNSAASSSTMITWAYVNGTFFWGTGTAIPTAGSITNAMLAGSIAPSNLLYRGLLINIQYLTSGTTYTPTTGTNTAVLHMVGGGGGGGGCTGVSSDTAAGGGGASGAFLMKRITGVTGTYTYAIGGTGSAGSTSGGNGGVGGDTTFTNGGTTYTAKGGNGGIGMTAGTTNAVSAGGAGVIATNGDINTGGQAGGPGIRFSGTIAISGNGGSNIYGGGGAGISTTAAGNNGTGYGSGGGGAMSSSSTARAGGVGQGGIIVVYEFA